MKWSGSLADVKIQRQTLRCGWHPMDSKTKSWRPPLSACSRWSQHSCQGLLLHYCHRKQNIIYCNQAPIDRGNPRERHYSFGLRSMVAVLELALEEFKVGAEDFHLSWSLRQEGEDEKRVLVEALKTILTPGLCLPDIQRLHQIIAVHFPGDLTISCRPVPPMFYSASHT